MREVRYSLAQLEQATNTLASDQEQLAVDGIQLGEWGPDVESNRVEVSLRRPAQNAQRILDQRYGSGMIVVSPTPAPAAIRYDRFSDSPPFYGGDRITSGGVLCTSGPSMRDGSGHTYALTAGHCGSVGTVWSTHGIRFGTETKRSFSNNGLDTAAIATSAGPYVWRNGGSTARQSGEAYPLVGGSVCADGSVSGEVCGVKIQNVDICVKFADGITTCHLDQGFRGSINVAQSGDSGGPVYDSPTSTGLVYIAGTIVGGFNSNQGVWYQEIDRIDSAFGLGVLTS